MSRDAAIAIYNLSKRYPGSKKYAVRGLDIDITPGQVYGFLGPNGAGKSTTIRLLMNFLRPTSGEAYILGCDTVTRSEIIKKTLGYLPGEIALYPKMTGRQFLDYMAALQPPKRSGYVNQLIKHFRFDPNQLIGKLSKGNRQKLAIIQAFMHEPEVLILDEPTGGLDPLMQEAFFELVRVTKKSGATFFISSHNLTEVQKMCDQIGFIRAGKLIAEQNIKELSNLASQTYDISFADSAPLAELRAISRSKVIPNTKQHVTIRVRGDLTSLFGVLARHKVNSLDRREINLEDEFLRFYKDGK